MPGWRKLLTIEVRDVSRPGIFFYVENYKYDWHVNTDQMNFDAFYANAKKHRKPYL